MMKTKKSVQIVILKRIRLDIVSQVIELFKNVPNYSTGLIWEKSGSPDYMLFSEVQNYIQGLNKKKFAGYSDWRLPTLEELSSLLENKKVKGLFINPLFDRKQYWCCSSDKNASGNVWFVYFLDGYVSNNKHNFSNVHLLRSFFDGNIEDWDDFRDNLRGNSYVRGVRSRTIDY